MCIRDRLGGAVGMYFGGPVGAVGIGTLTTGVVDYRVEQYKLEIERKEAKDISCLLYTSRCVSETGTKNG